jgi:hypothetical protein
LNTRGATRTFMGRRNSPFLNRLAHGPLLADGAMGTLLFQRGIPFERCFDELNLSQPGLVEQVHREYLAAGAELIETNTFGANTVRLSTHALGEKARVLSRQGAKLARNAREVVGAPAFVAGSMGPLGAALAPFGVISTAEAEAAFRSQAEGLLEGGTDVFILETFQDLNEILAALRAVRAVTAELPIIAQMTSRRATATRPRSWCARSGRRAPRWSASTAAWGRRRPWSSSNSSLPRPTARRCRRCRMPGCPSSSRAATSTSRARTISPTSPPAPRAWASS